MGGYDLADRSCLATHDQAVGSGSRPELFYSIQELTIGNSGGCKKHIFRRDQIVHGQHFFEIISLFPSPANSSSFLANILPWISPPIARKAQADKHPFGSSTNSQQDVDP